MEGNRLNAKQLAFYEKNRSKIAMDAKEFGSYLDRLAKAKPDTKFPVAWFDAQTRKSGTEKVPLTEVLVHVKKDEFLRLLQHLPEQECGYGYKTMNGAGSFGLYQFERPTWGEASRRYSSVVGKAGRIEDNSSQVRLSFAELAAFLYRFKGCYAAAIAAWNGGPYRGVLYGMAKAKESGKSEEEILKANAQKLGKDQAEYVNNVLFRIGMVNKDVVSGLFRLKPQASRKAAPPKNVKVA